MSLPGFDFDARTHTYRFHGRQVPNVTSIMQPWSPFLLVEEEVLEAARVFGTAVHDAIHADNIGELDDSTLTPDVLACVNSWRELLDDLRASPIYSELRVYSRSLDYAGTLDTIVALKGTKEPRLFDVKTGSTVPKTVGPQTAAYNEAFKEMMQRGRGMRRYCAHIQTDKYRLIPLKDPRDWDVFKAALTVHRWYKERR